MRPIDADALKTIYEDRLNILEERYGFFSEVGVLAGAIKLLDMQPTIEPERKRGRWIETDNEQPYDYICSEYGYGSDWEDNFCARCGAVMTEEQDD